MNTLLNDPINVPIPLDQYGNLLIPLCLTGSGMAEYAQSRMDSAARLVCDRLLSDGDEYFHLQTYELCRGYLEARIDAIIGKLDGRRRA